MNVSFARTSTDKRKRALSVGAKFALIIVLCTALVVTASVAAITYRLQAQDAVRSEELARSTARRLSTAVQNVFERAFEIVDFSHDDLIALKDDGVTDPHVYDTILKRMIQSDPDRYGAWLIWDAQDAPIRPAATTAQTDFSVYWHQNGMEMLRDALPREIVASDLYRVPRQRGQAYLLEPHAIDARNGDPTLVTSFSRPINHDGHIVGALALDVKLDAITNALGGIPLPEGAAITVISDGGIIAMSSRTNESGRSVDTVGGDVASLYQRARRGDGAELNQAWLTAWTKINFNGVTNPWYLLVRVPKEALLSTNSKDALFIGLVGAGALLAMLCVVLTAMRRLVSGPLKALADVISGLSAGLFDLRVPGTRRTDEVGEIARAVERLQDSKVEIARLREESGEIEYRRQMERQAERASISRRFSAQIEALVGRLDGVAATVESQSQEVSRNLVTIGTRVGSVSDISEAAREGMGCVAGATAALMEAIDAIRAQRQHALAATETVGAHTASTDASLAELRHTIEDIDRVATLINKIAAQINLIALNATIEAARAGEAGRGFAVVAQEIKHLATQTARATDEIGQLVGAVHSASGDAADKVGQMQLAFGDLRDVTQGIAGALEIQLGATREIRDLAGAALAGAGRVSTDMSELVGSSGQIQAAADVMLTQSGILGKGIAELKAEVASFLNFLEAA